MENIRVKEYLDIKIDRHPFYKSLNEKIIEDAKMLEFYPPEDNYVFTNIKGSQYNFDAGKEPDSIKSILKWIEEDLNDLHLFSSSHRLAVSGRSFNYAGCWLAKYNKGDYTLKHWHYPSTLSFVYFVKSPKGSSPLVFSNSGKKVKSEEGKVVIFPGNMMHHVPKNNCNDRITLAGNFSVICPGY